MHDAAWIEKRLFETEVRNLELFGYGIKGFTLSMIETAIELSEGRISGAEIQQIVEAGRAMLEAPVDLIPGVRRALFVNYRNQTDAGRCKDIHCIHERRTHDAEHVGDIVGYEGFDKGFTGGHFHNSSSIHWAIFCGRLT